MLEILVKFMFKVIIINNNIYNIYKGKISGRLFIYDNRGKISVFIGNVENIFNNFEEEKDRKICDLKVSDKRKDPTLFVIEYKKTRSILLVVGGHFNNSLSKAKFVDPYSDILVYEIKEKTSFDLNPILRIQMKYPRASPIVFKYSKKNLTNKIEEYLIILGGNCNKKFKNMKNFHEVNSCCEIINMKTLRFNLIQNYYGNSKKVIPSDDIVTILYNNSNEIKKIPILESFGVVKKKNNLETKETIIFLVGKKKIYAISIFIDTLEINIEKYLKGPKEAFNSPSLISKDSNYFHYYWPESSEIPKILNLNKKKSIYNWIFK